MMALATITRGPRLFTPEEAQYLFEHRRYTLLHHRFKPFVAHKYADMMRRKTFRVGTPITFARCHGTLWLVDGQHTLCAIGLTQQPLVLTVRILECGQHEPRSGDLWPSFEDDIGYAGVTEAEPTAL